MMLPQFCDLPLWASSLIIDFPTDNIPILTSEADWQFWGNQLIQQPSFSSTDSPRTDLYKDWKSWAWDMFYTNSNNN
jgi:hypothetical protein